MLSSVRAALVTVFSQQQNTKITFSFGERDSVLYLMKMEIKEI